MYVVKFFLFIDQSVFIKVNFVKPSYDASKQLTILINWHTKLPLAKGEGSNRVTGEGSNRVIGDILETSFPPPNGASDLEAVDDTDQVINYKICDWACKNQAYLHKLHMFRKWYFPQSQFMINMFCKIHLLSN